MGDPKRTRLCFGTEILSAMVANPHTKLPRSYPAEGVRTLVSRKWPMDIARLQEQRDILMVLLQERASHEEKQR